MDNTHARVASDRSAADRDLGVDSAGDRLSRVETRRAFLSALPRHLTGFYGASAQLQDCAAELGVTLETPTPSVSGGIVGEVDGVRFRLSAAAAHQVTVLVRVKSADQREAAAGEALGAQAGCPADGGDAEVALTVALAGSGDPAHQLREAVAAVRRHRAQQGCAHEGALRCCPRCGLELVSAEQWR
jgi:hypothetical protein